MPSEWQTFWEAISVFQFFAWVLGVAALFGFVAKVWPWLRRAVKTVDALGQLPEFIERTDKQIAEIHHEVNFNNGSSVKDGVRRAENGIDRMEKGVKALFDRVDALAETDETLRADLDDTRDRLPKQI